MSSVDKVLTVHKLTLDQFRTTIETGGLLSVSLVAQGGVFHIQVETRRGEAVLTKARSTDLRGFRNANQALGLLRELGIREARVDTKNWRPEDAEGLRPPRPDRAAQMKAAHEAAELKQVLEERIRLADDPAAEWIDHDELFAALETRYAG
jgi:hypothetical protein